MLGPKAICEQCGQGFWKAKDWQRFCRPKCRDDWHNHQRKIALVDMSGFRPTEELRQAAMKALSKMRRAESPDAPHPWRNSFSQKGERKPLNEILEALKPKPQPSFKRRAW
jgi:hypothetical protein